jgi:DNA mismatch repair protein MutL
MASPICRLPEQLINQVAAGEVIERPAAAVKELVENALDAGASSVGVKFRRAGKDFISVQDNGSGMDRESAQLAMERHATSKIRSIGDLHRVRSFGFRGEALPSIASISHFILRTRRGADPVGTEIAIDDGRQIAVRECVCPAGTQVSVSHLFQSVPARRKFLKSDETEANHITGVLRLFALDFPEVEFSLSHDTRRIFSVSAAANSGDRIRALWGDSLFQQLMPISRGEGDFRLSGYITNPHCRGWSSEEMVFFVNRRVVLSRELRDWLLDAYQPLLPHARALPCFLFLELPTECVDVNVHPAKREVRFSRRGELRDFIRRAISGHLTPPIGSAFNAQTTASATHSAADWKNWTISESIAISPPGREEDGKWAEGPRWSEMVPQPMPMGEEFPTLSADSQGCGREGVQLAAAGDESFIRATPPHSSGAHEICKWRFIGKMDARYALFTSETGLVFLDLQGAAVRVAYEKLLREVKNPQRQRLLLPITLNLSHLQCEMADAIVGELDQVGFTLEKSAGSDFRVAEMPTWLDETAGKAFLYDWLLHRRRRTAELQVEFLAKIAAQHIAPTRSCDSAEQIQLLLSELMGCAVPTHVPDGTAVFFEMSHDDFRQRWTSQVATTKDAQ